MIQKMIVTAALIGCLGAAQADPRCDVLAASKPATTLHFLADGADATQGTLNVYVQLNDARGQSHLQHTLAVAAAGLMKVNVYLGATRRTGDAMQEAADVQTALQAGTPAEGVQLLSLLAGLQLKPGTEIYDMRTRGQKLYGQPYHAQEFRIFDAHPAEFKAAYPAAVNAVVDLDTQLRVKADSTQSFACTSAGQSFDFWAPGWVGGLSTNKAGYAVGGDIRLLPAAYDLAPLMRPDVTIYMPPSGDAKAQFSLPLLSDPRGMTGGDTAVAGRAAAAARARNSLFNNEKTHKACVAAEPDKCWTVPTLPPLK